MRSFNATARTEERHAAFWLISFVVLQICCQLMLLSERLGGFRVVARSAAFCVSLVYLLAVPGRERMHPARPYLLGAILVVLLCILHPTTNSPLSGIAQGMLYCAVAAPLFWACRLYITEETFRRLILIIWAFHTASAMMGVLQTHYPGRFQPSISTAIESLGVMKDAYKIHLAEGTYTWRPMGLTDTPGAAASSGLFAVVFGLGVFLQYRSGAMRLASVVGMAVGMFCLYISQVRALMAMAGICTIGMFAVFARRGELEKHVNLAAIVSLISILTFVWAVRVGGQETADRLYTFGKEGEFQNSRGRFFTTTVNDLLPQYPLGAGLGRWGMMRNYFGDESNRDSPMIWVEIQITAWLLDGGWPLIFLYYTAVLIAAYVSLKIALADRRGPVPIWGIMMFSLNLAYIAVTFSYPLFIGQLGMEFWLFNASLFTMAAYENRKNAILKQTRARTPLPAHRSSRPR